MQLEKCDAFVCTEEECAYSAVFSAHETVVLAWFISQVNLSAL